MYETTRATFCGDENFNLMNLMLQVLPETDPLKNRIRDLIHDNPDPRIPEAADEWAREARAVMAEAKRRVM